MAQPEAFSFPDFRHLTRARFLFGFAVQVQAVVMGWQVYQIKHDPLYLGLVGLAEALPALSLALVSGYLVDRSNPLRIYRGVLLVSFLSALILFLVSGDWLISNDLQRLPWIYVAAVVTGIGRGFSGPSLYSLVPQIIPRKSLSQSSAWITSAFQVASVSGPAIGGILYGLKGPLASYGLALVMLFGAVLSAGLIRLKPKPPLSQTSGGIFENLTLGMRFVFKSDLLLSALALDMFAVFFGGVVAILPVFASDILKVGPTGLGILRAAQPAGALVSSIYLIRRPIQKNAGRILLWVVAGFGLSIIGFGLSRNLYLSLFFLATAGGLDAISMVIRGAIVQLSSPEEMRGRIAAVNYLFIGSSNELGAFESGMAARLLGTVPSVLFGGTMTLLVVALAWLRVPRLRRLNLDEI